MSNKDDIKEALGELFDERRKIDEPKHKLHHDFVEVLVIKAKKRDDLIEKAKGTLVGALVIVVLGWLAWLGDLVIDAWKAMRF